MLITVSVFFYYLWAIVIVLLYFTIVDGWMFSRSPATYFVILHTGLFIATFANSNFEKYPEHFELCNFIGLGLTMFVLGSIFISFILNYRVKKEHFFFSKKPFIDDLVKFNQIYFYITLVVSLLVTILFIYSIGGIIPLLALQAYAFSNDLGGAGELYIESRRNIAHGDEYLAPGIAMQFKDWLLSLCCLILFFKQRLSPSRLHNGLFIIIFIITLISLTSSGGRGNLVLFGFAFLAIGSSYLGNPLNINKRRIGFISILGLFSLSFLTILMGRSGSTLSLEGLLLSGPEKIFTRIFEIPAIENLIFYRKLILVSPIQWGGEWLSTLATVLPGKQEPLSVKLAQMLHYGAGNAVLNVWTSYLYNFGWFGLITAFIWGCMLQLLFIRFIRGRKSLIRYALFMYTFVLISFAIDPFGLFLYGTLVMFIFYAFLRFVKIVFKPQ